MTTSNLLSKFKKHENNADILNYLKRIENKQDDILRLLGENMADKSN